MAYQFSADPARIDHVAVHRWLSEHSYWAQGRSREVQDAAIAGSRSYGVYDERTGAQVAYARVVTDGVTFAWLCDVIVDPGVRGNGAGTLLVEGVVADLDALRLKRILLKTADAHGLYRKVGFEPLTDADQWMERPAPSTGP